MEVPGRLDTYRFMTFYLDSDKANFEDFYGKVVDQTWLTGKDPNAAALRHTRQSAHKPPCWRVTSVSRKLPDTVPDIAPAQEKAMQSADISSNTNSYAAWSRTSTRPSRTTTSRSKPRSSTSSPKWPPTPRPSQIPRRLQRRDGEPPGLRGSARAPGGVLLRHDHRERLGNHARWATSGPATDEVLRRPLLDGHRFV
ncbi:hypothetical protein ACFV9D_00285 [Streptomyces sp. NPDC059875]|uniref:hypothetical protein n=1 Tax=unclassified Streptomyces TaxID=2593676 RepID=UPI00364B281B